MTKDKIKAADLAVLKGLTKTRSQAQALILAGRILADGLPVRKAGQLLSSEVYLSLKEGRTYVSRGGFKLAGALEDFNLEVKGLKVLDAGASTGGFTDCLLQKGASWVTAADVGRGLIDFSLRNDPRVLVIENLNLRRLTLNEAEEKLKAPFELITADLSFISLKLILPALAPLVIPGGHILALVKPQFEAGPEKVGKKGIVKDPAVIKEATQSIIAFVPALNPPFTFLDQKPSRLTGAGGNQEIFIFLQREI
ncbi:MAG: TlyA family RNA methyltransferase [Deltaproteobacteria bacterium]|nr:TlyA family RNA methyltransferase [Deltaproteobacteria bacterium]